MPDYSFEVVRREYSNNTVGYFGKVNPIVVFGREREPRERPSIGELVNSFFVEGLLCTDPSQLITIDVPKAGKNHIDNPLDFQDRADLLR